jgi:hypothetical protein
MKVNCILSNMKICFRICDKQICGDCWIGNKSNCKLTFIFSGKSCFLNTTDLVQPGERPTQPGETKTRKIIFVVQVLFLSKKAAFATEIGHDWIL